MTKLEPMILDFKAKEVICIFDMLDKASMHGELIDDPDIREDTRVVIDDIEYFNTLLKSHTPEYIANECKAAGCSTDVETLFNEVGLLNIS